MLLENATTQDQLQNDDDEYITTEDEEESEWYDEDGIPYSQSYMPPADAGFPYEELSAGLQNFRFTPAEQRIVQEEDRYQQEEEDEEKEPNSFNGKKEPPLPLLLIVVW